MLLVLSLQFLFFSFFASFLLLHLLFDLQLVLQLGWQFGRVRLFLSLCNVTAQSYARGLPVVSATLSLLLKWARSNRIVIHLRHHETPSICRRKVWIRSTKLSCWQHGRLLGGRWLLLITAWCIYTHILSHIFVIFHLISGLVFFNLALFILILFHLGLKLSTILFLFTSLLLSCICPSSIWISLVVRMDSAWIASKAAIRWARPFCIWLLLRLVLW